MGIRVNGNLMEAIFIKRLNRFLAEIEVHQERFLCHVPNTGRMKELLLEGTKIIVRSVDDEKRKTKYDLIMVDHKNIIVCIDSKLPNVLLDQAFKENTVEGFKGYNQVKREVTFQKSRFDLAVHNGMDLALIEAKCVTYVKENGVASFPDAPTERGRKHIFELIQAKNQGLRAAVFFVIQRQDAEIFTPNEAMDPAFARVVKEAFEQGVEFYAYTCRVDRDKIALWKMIPILGLTGNWEHDIIN